MMDGLLLMVVGALVGAILTAMLAVVIFLAGKASQSAESTALSARNGEGSWRVLVESSLDAVPDWVMHVGADGIVVECNAPTGGHFPYADRDATGKHIREVYPESALPTLLEHIDRVLETDRPLNFEFLHTSNHRYGEARVFPVGGNVLLVTRDMTDQKSKEDFLHRSKERFALAVQGANDGLWDWDLESNTVYYSYAWKQIMRVDPTEQANTPEAWFDRVHPDDVVAVKAALQAHLDGEAPRYESEQRIQLQDGKWLWVLTRGMAVRDARGVARRIAGSLTDLTNRRAVAVSEEKANLLEHATSSVGIGIAMLTAGQKIIDASNMLKDMTRNWQDVSAWWEHVHREATFPDKTRCPRCKSEQMVGTVLAELEEPLIGVSGQGQPRRIRVFEVAFAGHAHEIGAHDAHVLLIKDVTLETMSERQLVRVNEELTVARDAALAASRAKSAFLANMSHELRTPLNHIMGYSEMLGEELQDLERPELASDAQKIRTSGVHLLDLITGILDLSKIEAGISGIELTTFAVKGVIEAAIDSNRAQLDKHSNKLQLEVQPNLGDMLANEDQMKRILSNILSNAAKFTKDGVVTLRAYAEPKNGREWLVFSVADTGIGMSQEQINHLWERFYMADETSTRGEGGAGLGLTLAHRFTDMMGGAIHVTSVQGQGSTFRVVLPRSVTIAAES